LTDLSRLETICHLPATIHHLPHFCVRASSLSQVVPWDRLLSPFSDPGGPLLVADSGTLDCSPRRLSSWHYQNQGTPWQKLLHRRPSVHYTPIMGSGKKLHCLYIQIWPQYSLNNQITGLNMGPLTPNHLLWPQ
jgi:hypothetical protein